MFNSVTDTQPSTSFYIKKVKWLPKKVLVIHYGPFRTEELARTYLQKLRYNKHIDISVIEK